MQPKGKQIRSVGHECDKLIVVHTFFSYDLEESVEENKITLRLLLD